MPWAVGVYHLYVFVRVAFVWVETRKAGASTLPAVRTTA